MFVLTTKFNKRKLIAAVCAAVAVILLIVIVSLLASSDSEVMSSAATVRSNEQRITYLNSFGWEVDETPIEEETVIIPQQFGDVYEQYCKLQAEQGFDLSKFAGMEATRYTYKVLNHPSGEDVVADIIVCRDRVIAGDIQSTALDGFMTGLAQNKQ